MPVLSNRAWLKIVFEVAIALTIAVGMTFGYPTQSAHAARSIVQFYDGDNMTIVQSGIKTKIRLACIDAPELQQPLGDRARKTLKSLVGDLPIALHVFKRDRLGRLIAEVYADGENVNKLLVAQGQAHFDREQIKDCGDYEAIEQQAKDSHVGIWEHGADVQLPSQFRRLHR
ncbi:thermonuclease family protein [Tumidithrix elongata RA019]|uniref:Thermonuclease family protein n=1 Tax=Tumidithrix elongata BACA0141 TaxID=2716417 RepID=A0AAW9PYA2_9CYAN|nr:thermonuclease family protein [Tumidithrix elongata RA019]